jgi:hypothetical protein
VHIFEQLLAQDILPLAFHDEADGKYQLQHARLLVHDGIGTRQGGLHEPRPSSSFDESEEHLGIAEHFVDFEYGIHDTLLLVPQLHQSQSFVLRQIPNRVFVCM